MADNVGSEPSFAAHLQTESGMSSNGGMDRSERFMSTESQVLGSVVMNRSERF